MGDALELRRLGPDDLEAVLETRLRALEAEPEAFGMTPEEERARGRALFARILSAADGDDAVFAALDAGAVAGMIGVHREEHLKRRHRAVVWGMYVEPAARGAGVGGRLLELAIAHARGLSGVERLLLEVHAANAAARGLYASRGFRAWGTEPSALRVEGRELAVEHMVLELA